MIFSPVSALVIGAPGSEWILLPKQAAAFWEGHKKSLALFQKICWEEPEKQKTRSCRAQELSRSCAQWRGREWERCTEQVQPCAQSRTHKSNDWPHPTTATPREENGRSGEWRHHVGLDIGSIRTKPRKGTTR